MIDELAPIALFVYNRPEHTRKTLDALAKNILADKSRIYIFSDGPKTETDVSKVTEVRSLIKNISGFGKKIIYESESNKGLANSVIAGVTEVLTQHEKIIVMEDDLVSSATFLSFMNEALSFYQNNSRIFSVTGFCYPVQIPESYQNEVYAIHRPSSWGWGTWKEKWQKVDWRIDDFAQFKLNKRSQKEFNKCGNDLTPMLFAQMTGRIDSWAVRWAYSHFKNDSLCIFPVKALISHIGSDSSGTHFKSTSKFNVKIENEISSFRFVDLSSANSKIENKVKIFFDISPVRQLINRVKFRKI